MLRPTIARRARGCETPPEYGPEFGVSQEKSEAVVIRGVDFSESSRIVTFLAPRRGRLACIAKGFRRKGNPLAPVLGTLNRVELVYYWKDGRQVQNLAEATLLDGFSGIRSRLESSVFASFPLEVVFKAAHENEPSQDLYRTLVRGMHALDAWEGGARAHAAWQVLQLLAALGFEPVLDQCVHCGNALPAMPGFSLAGGMTCGACPSDRRLDGVTAEALRQCVASKTHCPVEDEGAALFQLVRLYAAHQLETDFRSVRVLEEMFGGPA